MKRMITFSFALMMTLSSCLMITSALDVKVARASPTLSGYLATMDAGSRPGELLISDQVDATTLASSLGVSSIVLYKANGTYVTTITGSTSNGLIRTSSNCHVGTYSYTATPGSYYYAKVTVYATTSTAYDSRTITTTTVRAPY